jgi:hypothetical protein
MVRIAGEEVITTESQSTAARHEGVEDNAEKER